MKPMRPYSTKQRSPAGLRIILVGALAAVAAADPPGKADAISNAGGVPRESLVHAGDYTFGYYPHGWRRASERMPIHFAIQTNRYALLWNATKAKIERLGPIASPLPGVRAVSQGNDVLNSLPAAEMSFGVNWNRRTFKLSAGAGTPDQVRLYRVGKYLQHFDIQTARVDGLEWANAWMESYCWADRFVVQMHLALHAGHVASGHDAESMKLVAHIAIPPDYPIVEALGPDGQWTVVQAGETSERAMLMRNEAGAGIAILTVPGADQRARLDKGVLTLEMDVSAMVDQSVRTLSCVVVPAADVRQAAMREVEQMQASAASNIRIAADGIAPYSGSLPVRYDAARGWHEILLGENNDANKMERVRLALHNPDAAPRTVRLNFAKIGKGFSITGMSPVLRDLDGHPIGLPVQISKNWHCAPVWFSGLTMLELIPGQRIGLEFDLAYVYWGNVPAVSHAQLCLLGWGVHQLWDEMAIGSWGESICYDPDVNLNRSMVDDMRPLMVWGMGKTPRQQWSWTHNVGGCDFLTLFLTSSPARQYLGRQKTLYSDYGPVLTDVTYAGQTPDGAIQSRIRTQSWRSDDYVRGLYTVRYDVGRRVENISRLAFFQLGADHYNQVRFGRVARGSAAGVDEDWEPQRGGRNYSRRGEPLAGTLPWIGTFGATKEPAAFWRGEDDQGAIADKAMIVHQWSARLGAQDCSVPCYSVYGSEDAFASAVVELSPPAGCDRLEPGDFVDAQVEVLVLPQRADDYYGPNANLKAALKAARSPWALAQREAAGTDIDVHASAGALEQAWPVRVRAENGTRAEFTIKGGIGYTPVTITGAAACRGFTLQEVLADGTARTIDQSSEVGNDWWQSRYDPASGQWDLTFTINLDRPDDRRVSRRFRWAIAAQQTAE
jgi:hypothetical protein